MMSASECVRELLEPIAAGVLRPSTRPVLRASTRVMSSWLL
jgi:hypothetical protein